MMLTRLRDEVCAANLELVSRGLVIESFGNVSGLDRSSGLVVIKPSGIDYAHLVPESLVITDLEGRIIEGTLRPSSDLPTHLGLYKAFPTISGIAHTHSHYATVWAQAGLEIPCLGTTHADYFPGPIPLTRPLTTDEIREAYEVNTGRAIVARLTGLDPDAYTAVLVSSHGPFCWGHSATAAAQTALVVEELARLAHHTVALNPGVAPLSTALRDKHFSRKHGPNAYYGQSTASASHEV